MQESYISELETKADRKARLMEDWKRQVGIPLLCSRWLDSASAAAVLRPRFCSNSRTVACFAIEPFDLH